jgi:hypothetical protein
MHLQAFLRCGIRSSRAALIALSVAAAPFLGACDPVCVGVPRPGLRLRVSDAQGGRVLDSVSTVTVQRLDGVQNPQRTGSLLPVGPSSPLAIAQDLGGTYVVTVEVPGYIPWKRQVRVENDDCGQPETVDLIAHVERASALGISTGIVR